MTTKEFIKEIEKLGYIVEKDNFDITIRIEKWCDEKELIATICYDIFGSIDTVWGSFEELSITKRLELLELCFKYTTTPIADRVEEEKFYWKLKGNENYCGNTGTYLNILNEEWTIFTNYDGVVSKTKFTQKEYDEFVAQELIADIFEKEPIE